MCESGFGELFSGQLCARHVAEIVKGSVQFSPFGQANPTAFRKTWDAQR
jgi:hypothetical protein